MIKNKFVITLIGIMLFNSLNIFSQSIGIKAGSVYNHFISGQQHVKSNLGITAGIAYHQPFNSKLGMMTGVDFLQLGGGLLIIEDNTRFGVDPLLDPYAVKIRDSKVTINSINFPVVLNYVFTSGDAVQMTFGIGPEVSFLISAFSNDVISSPYGGSNYWVTYSQTMNEANNYASFNVAVSTNLGVDFMIGNAPMGINFRYRYETMPARNEFSYLDLTDLKSDVYQGSVIITIEYKFNLTGNK
jgi:hypothetical protein